MRISIGMIAHNEAAVIAESIYLLSRQSLLTEPRRGWWVLPKYFFMRRLFRRFRKLKHLGMVHALIYGPVIIASMIFEIPVLIAANIELKKRRLIW